MGSRENEVYANETRSTVPSTVGGIMTEEVGAVTGDLELARAPGSGVHRSHGTVCRGPGVVHRRRKPNPAG